MCSSAAAIWLAHDLIDGGTVLRHRDGLAAILGDTQPRSLRLLNFPHCLFRCGPKGRAEAQVGNVGHVTSVGVAVKHVDVIVLHALSSSVRLYGLEMRDRVRAERALSSFSAERLIST